MGIFKFIVDAIKEGADEARAESAQEARDKAQKDEVQQSAQRDMERQRLDAVSPEELFLVSLGAPYRETFMPDLAKAKSTGRAAYYLRSMDVQDGERDSLTSLLERDFSVSDRASLLEMAVKTQALMYFAFDLKSMSGEPRALDELAPWIARALDEDHQRAWEEALEEARQSISQARLEQGSREQKGLVVLWVSRLAYAATVSAGLGLIGKQEVISLLGEVGQAARGTFDSWQEFAALFLIGDKADGSNNLLGRKVIGMTLKNLLTDERSPWLTHPLTAVHTPAG